MLTVTTDWVISITTIIGIVISILLGLPALNKYRKAKKYKSSKALLENKMRQLEVQPNFEIVSSEIEQLIKFRNTGFTANKFIFTTVNTPYIMLVPNKEEANTFEVVNLYLGDKFIEQYDTVFQVHFSYSDIDGRRYQQTYTRKQDIEKITLPELLITRAIGKI
jgi:hypothetical protein